MVKTLCLLFTSLLSIINNYVDVSAVIPGGENVALQINSDGVLVIGGYDVITSNEKYNPTIDSDIIKGDLIYEIEGNKINNIEQMLDNIELYYKNDSATLSIIRNQNKIKRELKFIKTSKADTIKTGLLVKDKILGIGTMTFYDSNTKVFGALGHKLYDNDFSSIVDINSGELLKSKVTGINKSTRGNVGEILASIYKDESLGTIFANTDYGVFGYYDKCPDKDAIEVLNHEEIKLGKAYILTTLDDNKINKYEIQITSLKKQDSLSTKGITFKIVDDELLDKTGGIIQGMSGSPIIQDGKLIGAVTHVLIDSVKKGYGIYMDYMIQASQIGR